MKTTASLLACWPLAGHAQDLHGQNHGTDRNVTWTTGPDGAAGGAASFLNTDSLIEVPHGPALELGARDFTIAAWIKCERPMRGVFGDVLSKFDAERRCGVNFWIAGSAPGYNSMGDTRHVHFGIDDAWLGPWQDCGRPWPSNPLITCLVAHENQLYAGLADADRPEDAAKVFRWAGSKGWEDCGRLGNDPEHLSAMSMLVHEGQLYAGTGIWDWGRAHEAGVAKPPRAMSHVFRYEGGTKWRDLGQVGRGVRVFCLASFDGALYAGLDRADEGGCYRLEGERWVFCGRLDENDNFECLMPIGGVLYGASHKAIYQYGGGERWTCIGRRPFDIIQIHAFTCFDGKLWIGTWPQGYVLRYDGDGQWTNTGLVGLAVGKPGIKEINEINALFVHNGKLYAGVLPKAEVWRYESDGHWTLLGSLASRPDFNQEICPSWLRVTTLATHRGRLFAGTGACQARAQDIDRDRTVGRVLACDAGIAVSHEQDIGGEWTHVAGVRRGRRLLLYVNGRLTAKTTTPSGHTFNLLNAEPLRIGRGPTGSFRGAIADVRLYGKALTPRAVARLAGSRRGELIPLG